MEESIRQQLERDLRTAMRAGDQTSRDAIRFILAAIKNAEIEHRGELSQADAVATLRRVGKQLADAAEQYRNAGRDDLADREAAQLQVLQRYLPAELSDADLASLATDVLQEVGASGPKDMGKVMPVLMRRVDGRADGRRVSAAAKAALDAAG